MGLGLIQGLMGESLKGLVYLLLGCRFGWGASRVGVESSGQGCEACVKWACMHACNAGALAHR